MDIHLLKYMIASLAVFCYLASCFLTLFSIAYTEEQRWNLFRREVCLLLYAIALSIFIIVLDNLR